MELLTKTILPVKQKGDTLSTAEVNSLNNTVNALVDCVNVLIKKYCNLNSEIGDDSRTFTLAEVVTLVPQSRRSPGMSVRFLGEDNIYHTYIYLNSEIGNAFWTNLENWYPDNTIIDGGVW